ncbi:DnaA regulatory inactivator Hda [Algibacillus agarilyticus]|uniref:DnaA regulatory inactivator Hda n=1 Tax=Algibacillus agarilyticus TaxID=2234133 RepID=UPI000DD0B40D|nr:DnaA regulatory inactivator Hda [Algibacillus agarilyticus]
MIQNQLTIDFAVDREDSLENFYTQGNEVLISALADFVQAKSLKPSDSILYIYGQRGTGKSHLLQAISQFTADQNIICQYIPMKAFVQYDCDATLGMEQFDILCVDDIDLLNINHDWQQAMFDLINRVVENGKKIIFSAKSKPADCQFHLADLVSRLEWGAIWRLEMLSDEQQIELMQFRANCKGMVLADDVANFIHVRLSRDPHIIMQCLEKLDKLSLEAQRRLTIPFVKSVMNW